MYVALITVMEPLKYLLVEVHGMEGKSSNQTLDLVKIYHVIHI